MSEQAAVASRPTTGATRRVAPPATRTHPSPWAPARALAHLVIWLVGLTGAAIPPEVAAASGGTHAAIFLLVGKRGIKGAIVGLWQGEQ